MKEELKFPEGFLWGASTSAHQVEGGTKNQWTEWEKENAKRLAEEAKTYWQPWQQERFPEMFESRNYVSGSACDHYNRYAEDFDIAKNLNNNAHRFGIEWSRIEPEEGKFDEKEVEHYRQVIHALKERGMEPFVCLWHWTNPVWLEEKGGCESSEFPKYFARYAKLMAEKLGDGVGFWLTINEPMSVIANCYMQGNWPPQKKNPISAYRALKILSRAHKEAYKEIHAVNDGAKVGFAHICMYFDPRNKKSLLDKLAVKVAEYFSNKKFINLTRGHNDFLALQYYFHNRISFFGGIDNRNESVTDLGWEIYQEGIYHLLKWMNSYGLPIYVTENGLADRDDKKRMAFIEDGLKWIHRAIEEGVPVKGYFHWSLLDNFEWDKGFWPRFGLVEIDYATMGRKVRKSALEYAEICRKNGLETDIEKKS